MSKPNLNDPAVLVAVLSSLNANDTAIIRKAEKALKPFMKTLACVPALMQQLTTSQDINIRHHSALLLKRKISVLYSKCSTTQREQLKDTILQIVVSEPNKAVRTAMAGMISGLSKAVFAIEKDWPNLFQLLLQLSQNPNEALRSLNYTILEQLCEHIGDHLKKHTATLAQMFIAGCQDASTTVAVDAMNAAANYFKFLVDQPSEQSPEIMQMESVIVPMLVVMQGCLQRGDENIVAEGLVVFQEICNMDQPLINNHLEQILPFVMSILQNANYEMQVKHAAGETLMSILESRPKLVAKKQMVEPILRAIVELIASGNSETAIFNFNEHNASTVGKGADDDDDDDDFDPEQQLQELSQQCLDRMSLSIPSKYFSPPAMAIASQCLGSPDARHRKAGLVLLGVIAEGCSDVLKTMLSQILPQLVASTQDSEFFVRETACFALGQLSEHCQPDILYHHATILPAIFKVLEDEKPAVQNTSCYVLEMFSENLQPDTLCPLLDMLVNRLLTLVSTAQPSTKEMALSALAASSVAAEDKFLPYAEACFKVIYPLMFSTEPALFSLRGRALECWGHIGLAIGKEQFTPYFESGIQSAMQGIQLDDQLKEFAYIYFANGAKVMKNAFDPSLKQLVEHLLEVIQESELTMKGGDDEMASDDEDDEVEYEDDEDDDDEGGGSYRLNVYAGFINNKKAALQALGALAEYTKASFFQVLDGSLDTLLAEHAGALNSYHPDIRCEAITCLVQMMDVVLAQHGPCEPPKQGVVVQLHEVTNEMLVVILSTLINIMDGDGSKDCVGRACDGVSTLLQKVGVVGLTVIVDQTKKTPAMEPLIATLSKLVNEKGTCQLEENYEQHEGDDDDDHDDKVMDSVVDVIGTLAKCMGVQVVPYFDNFVKPLLKFCKPTRSHSDRAMAIGCFGEVVSEIGTESMKYADTILPVLKTALSDEMEPVRRNAAYAVGALVESGGAAMSNYALPILQVLHPLCIRPPHQQASDVGGADIDNALSTVCRMINTLPGVIPLNSVIPVLVAALPLRSDMVEGTNVYSTLTRLISENEPTVLSMLPQILTLFAEVLSDASHAEDTTKAVVKTGLKQMLTIPNQASMLASAVNQIPDANVQNILQAAVNS